MKLSSLGMTESGLLLLHFTLYNVKLPDHIQQSVIKNNYYITALLLEYGANPNVRDSNGYTALLSAIELQYIQIIELLVQNPLTQLYYYVYDKDTKKNMLTSEPMNLYIYYKNKGTPLDSKIYDILIENIENKLKLQDVLTELENKSYDPHSTWGRSMINTRFQNNIGYNPDFGGPEYQQRVWQNNN